MVFPVQVMDTWLASSYHSSDGFIKNAVEPVEETMAP